MNEVTRRENLARAAIHQSFITPEDESSTILFLTHHLEEMESEYWQKHLGTIKPEQNRILDILVLRSHWGGDDDLEIFDFTLPGKVTDYVISVSFNESGEIDDITMES